MIEAGSLTGRQLYVLERISNMKQDRLSEGELSDDELRIMIDLVSMGLASTEYFNTTNNGKIRNLAPYYLLTKDGQRIVDSRL